MASNVMLIIFMIVTILLLFTTMIFSAMGADKTKDCKEGEAGSCTVGAGQRCHKNSMYAALITGVSCALLVVCLVIYMYSTHSDNKAEVAGWLSSLSSKLSPAQLQAVAEAAKSS